MRAEAGNRGHIQTLPGAYPVAVNRELTSYPTQTTVLQAVPSRLFVSRGNGWGIGVSLLRGLERLLTALDSYRVGIPIYSRRMALGELLPAKWHVFTYRTYVRIVRMRTNTTRKVLQTCVRLAMSRLWARAARAYALCVRERVESLYRLV